jgi:glyoxylase-like metal-dependent hydrolase (beta-lactamase superfamily II)
LKNKSYALLQPATFRLDGGAMYGIIPKPLWEKKSPPDEQNRILLSLRLWLIATENHLVLVDTGIGDYHGEKFDGMFDIQGPPSPLAQSLNQLGYNLQDITDVVLSHLHFDHAGGIGSMIQGQWQATFPKAMIHLHQQHYQYSLHPTARDEGSFHQKYFKPIIENAIAKNQLHWLTGEEGVIIDQLGLKFRCSHGHTPHLIHPYDENFIYLADIIPTSHHVKIPWVMGYDIYPGLSVKDKKDILHFVYENKLKIIFEHDPDFAYSNVALDERGQINVNQLCAATKTTAMKISSINQ